MGSVWAETHKEGSWPLCASVSPFVTGAPAWVSGWHWDYAECVRRFPYDVTVGVSRGQGPGLGA